MSHRLARHGLPRRTWVSGLLTGALIAGVAIGLPYATASGPGAATEAIDRMAARCVQQMISDTCRAANDASDLPASGAKPTVFVAGVGMIDGAAYAEIRRSGQAMCNAALASCRRSVSESACKVARQLWGDTGTARAR